MALRPELLYQPPRPERAEAFLRRALEIAAMAELGLDASELLAEFNVESGREWRADALLFMLRGGDLPALALKAASPPPSVISDLTHEELIDVVALIRDSELPAACHYIDLFEMNVGRLDAASLLFWPPDKRAWRAARRKLAEWQPGDGEIVDLVSGS